MLDTVKHAVLDFEIDQRIISSRPHTSRNNKIGQTSHYLIRQPGEKFNISLFEQSVVIQLSVPKYLFGTNIYEVSDLDLDTYAAKLALDLEKAGILTSTDAIKSSLIKRVDFCRNIPFLGEVNAYLSALSKVSKGLKTDTEDISYKNLNTRDGHQIVVGNKSFRSTVYDKLAEASRDQCNQAALDEFQMQFPQHALLRLEHALENSKAVKRFLHGYEVEPTLKSVWSSELAQKILQKAFREIFNEGKIADQSLIALLVSSKIDPITKGLLYFVREEGLVRVFNEMRKSYSEGKSYRLRKSVMAHLRDPTNEQPEEVQSIHKYLIDFKPILKPPICAPLTVHSTNS